MEDGDFGQELNALKVISSELSGLEQDAQQRIVDWAIDAFDLVGKQKPFVSPLSPDCDTAEGIHGSSKSELPEYAHFAELFADAGAKTNEEKVLVAAYWVQVIEGRGSWKSSELQNLLKDLGETVNNISDYLTKAIRRRPARVLQLSKSGNSKQARKTYKLTQPGITLVEQMKG